MQTAHLKSALSSRAQSCAAFELIQFMWKILAHCTSLCLPCFIDFLYFQFPYVRTNERNLLIWRNIFCLLFKQLKAMNVLPIRCRTTNAELHKNLLGSGTCGRCICHQGRWYTPRNFEIFCGRSSSKEWKRSIFCGSKKLQDLIEKGVLTPHKLTCRCLVSCDNRKFCFFMFSA